MDFFHGWQTALSCYGTMDMSLESRCQIFQNVQQSQMDQMNSLGSRYMNTMGIDPLDSTYQSFRSGTHTGLEIASLATGAYGLARKTLGAATCGLGKWIGAEKLSLKRIQALQIEEFKYTNTAAKHLTELVKRGPNAGKLARPFMRSPLTIKEIMFAKKPIPDPGGLKGGLSWNAPGTFRGSEGTRELVLNPKTQTIYHFNFK